MRKIKYESNTGCDDCIFEVEANQVESCIEAELETAKKDFQRDGVQYRVDYFVDNNGNSYTEIWEPGGNRYIRWTRL